LRVAHHLKDDITTAVCLSRKGKVATLSTESHFNRTTVVITTWLEANWAVLYAEAGNGALRGPDFEQPEIRASVED
jgi:hypothetical protein